VFKFFQCLLGNHHSIDLELVVYMSDILEFTKLKFKFIKGHMGQTYCKKTEQTKSFLKILSFDILSDQIVLVYDFEPNSITESIFKVIWYATYCLTFLKDDAVTTIVISQLIVCLFV